MIKKLMFLFAMVAGLFASCADNNVVDEGQDNGAKKVKLSINADLGSASRVAFTPNGDGLKTSFQEGDYMMVYFRKADGSWLGKTVVLYYVPGSANGTKGTFAGSIDEIPEGTGLLHILMGSTKGGTPYIAAAAGECALIDDLSSQEGTLEDAALHSVFQADPYTEDNLTVDEAKGTATISNVTFKPKTSVVKIQTTFPEGVTVEKGTELTVTTKGTYNKVQISGGNPGGSSTPSSASAAATFTVKVAEVSGTVATAYMTIWPGRAATEFDEVKLSAEIGDNTYEDTYVKQHAGSKLEAGKLYTIETYLSKAMKYKTVWLKDDAADNVLTVVGTGAASDASWLTVVDGKIKVEANTTGAPRTGQVVTDEYTYTVTQIEVKDFKGTWSLYSKKFNASNSVGGSASASVTAVTIGEPLKAETLSDEDGTEYTNNIGVKGLYFDTTMSGTVVIDYDNCTVKVGLFFDSREAQATGNATYPYAVYLPEGCNTAYWNSKGYTFSPLDYSANNYAWLWLTVSSDFKQMQYIYYGKAQKIGNYYVCGISIPYGTSSDISSINGGVSTNTYDCIYQANYNVNNNAGMYFAR